MTLPQLKVRWLDDASKERACSLQYSHARNLENFSTNTSDPNIEKHADFFCFAAKREGHGTELATQKMMRS